MPHIGFAQRSWRPICGIFIGTVILYIGKHSVFHRLPGSSIKLIPILFRSQSNRFFKCLDKMTLRRKSQIICNINKTVVGIFQQMLRFFDLFFVNIITDSNAKLFFEKPRQIAGRQVCIVCKLFDGNAAV